MIPVFLCEDDRRQLLSIGKIIDGFLFIDGLDMELSGSFLSPGELLDAVKEKPPFMALYFLDVDLKSDMDGIQLAGKIREYDARAFIVFLTTHEEMAFRTLKEKVEPLDYIIKGTPDFAAQIEKCLKSAAEKYAAPQNPTTDILSLPVSDGLIFVKKQDIYFIESTREPHKINIHKQNETISIRSSLKKINGQLDERFFQCHGSCIINLTHVKKIDRRTLTVIFDNEASCPCSIRKYSFLTKS